MITGAPSARTRSTSFVSHTARSLPGKYRPVIDRTYALDEVVEATRYVETGQKTGNVVLRVSEAAPDEQPEPAASTI